MPSADEIQTYLTGAWRLMNGKPDGVRQLDVSIDGFWNSFFAILIAAPAMFVSWVSLARELAGPAGGAMGFVVRLALVDLAAWVLPLALIALGAGAMGFADRFVHYVVASNWASVLLVWLMLPSALLQLLWPGASDIVATVSLLLFILSLVLTWRLTNAVIDRGAGIATGVFAAMLVLSFATLFAAQSIFGIAPASAG